MKKFAIVLVFSLTTGFVFAQTKTNIERAISIMVDDISQVLTSGDRVAVISIEAESRELSNYVINQIGKGLINKDKFIVLERERLAPLQRELEFNMSGSVDMEQRLRVGRYFAADIVIYGKLEDYAGNDYKLTIYVTDGLTAIQKAIIDKPIIKDDKVLNNLYGSDNPRNDWKYKWLYIDIWSGFGNSIYPKYWDEYKNIYWGGQFSFHFANYFAIGTELSGAYNIRNGNHWVFLNIIPRVTIRPSLNYAVDIFIGPSFGPFNYYDYYYDKYGYESGYGKVDRAQTNFFGGVDLGYHIGPGFLFVDARLHTYLGFSLGLGYRVGFINKERE
jgi:hypothetical protein